MLAVSQSQKGHIIQEGEDVQDVWQVTAQLHAHAHGRRLGLNIDDIVVCKETPTEFGGRFAGAEKGRSEL